MKKLISLILISALILMMGISACAEQETYRIGVMLPLTGVKSSGGQDAKKGIEMALERINSNGGIQGKQLELIICDANDADSAIAEIQRLIEIEKVQVVTGTYEANVAYAASAIAEQAGVFFFELASPADALCQRGFKYFFRMNPTASYEGRRDIDFIVENLEKLDTTIEDVRVAVINVDSVYGGSIASGALAGLESYGIEPVLVESYAADSADFSSLVMKLIQEEPDVIVCGTTIEDTCILYRQAYELGLETKAWIGNGAGIGSSVFNERFGQMAQYTFSSNYTIETSPAETAPGLADFYAEYRERYNQDPVNTVLVPQVAQGMLILQQILNNATDIYDASTIVESALSIDIPAGTMINGWGAKFAGPDAELPGQNMANENVIMSQWIDGVLYQVWPEASEGIELVLPAPAFGGQ